MAERWFLGRRDRESGPIGPVSGFDAPKSHLSATVPAARANSSMDGALSSVTMLWHRSTPNALPCLNLRSVKGISMYEDTA